MELRLRNHWKCCRVVHPSLLTTITSKKWRKFVPEGQTVNKEYYLAVLRRLRETIRRKRPDLWADNSWIFHHDNVPSHSNLIVTEFLAKHETKVMAHRIRQIWLPVTFSCFQFNISIDQVKMAHPVIKILNFLLQINRWKLRYT